jgi:protein O-mannosyl-transferase
MKKPLVGAGARGSEAKKLVPDARQSPSTTRPMWTTRVTLCAIGLATIVFALYWNVRSNQFIRFDDDIYVYANDRVKRGLTLDGLRWALTNVDIDYWHPLTWLSHMLDVQWFGLNPAGHHVVSALWHAANAGVLMVALWYMTGCLWRSVVVAAIFAMHPLRVESVAWVSERKDVLSSFFYFCALWAYAWYARLPQSWRRYSTVAVLFSFGLMSKPSVVSFPVVILLLDFWPLHRKESLIVLLREKIPFVALAAAVSVVTYFSQKQVGAMESIQGPSSWDRLANPLVSYAHYLGKLFWPHPLAVIYPYQRNLSAFSVVASCMLLAAVTGLVFLLGSRFRYLPVGWLWFLGAMLPMVGVVQVGGQAYADRYTYVPSIGVFIALVWSVADGLENRDWGRGASIALALALLPALALATSSQLPYWHDDLGLFQHAVEVTANNAIAEYHVGNDLVETGRPKDAIPHLEHVVRLRPSYYAGYYTLGKAQAVEGNNLSAVQNFSEALHLKPDYAEAHYSRAVTLAKMGSPESAELDFRAALGGGLSVVYLSDAHNALGVILAERSDLKMATEQFEQAVHLQPASVPAQRNLALVLRQQGRTEDAIAHLEQAISAAHGDATLRRMLDELRAPP